MNLIMQLMNWGYGFLIYFRKSFFAASYCLGLELDKKNYILGYSYLIGYLRPALKNWIIIKTLVSRYSAPNIY